jgi:hypothetical protein
MQKRLTIEEIQKLIDQDVRWAGKTTVIGLCKVDPDAFRVLFSNGREWTLYISCLNKG